MADTRRSPGGPRSPISAADETEKTPSVAEAQNAGERRRDARVTRQLAAEAAQRGDRLKELRIGCRKKPARSTVIDAFHCFLVPCRQRAAGAPQVLDLFSVQKQSRQNRAGSRRERLCGERR